MAATMHRINSRVSLPQNKRRLLGKRLDAASSRSASVIFSATHGIVGDTANVGYR
jgi:hypothetical protein